jgi:hypothetical protein
MIITLASDAEWKILQHLVKKRVKSLFLLSFQASFRPDLVLKKPLA